MYEFTKIQHTKILPLRWFANLCGIIAHFFLDKYLKNEYHGEEWKLKIYGPLFSWFQAPNTKWGTFYTMDPKTFLEEIEEDNE